MKILITSECLRFGGAQIFALRLAKYLSQSHQVLFYYHFKDYIDEKMVKEEFSGVNLLYPRFPFIFDFVLRKLDRVFYYVNLDISLRNFLVTRHIRNIISEHKFDLVHSHMFKSNYLFAKALNGKETPLIVTTHGCFENFYNSHKTGVGERIINYPEKLLFALNRVNGLAYLTEKNKSIIEQILPNYGETRPVKKIYNGYIKKTADIEFNAKKELGIDHGGFIFGMVARGIEEKGWQEVIDAFSLLRGNNHLILVGGSDYLWKLKERVSNSKIHFIGFSEKPVNWINVFDVGLLPSYFAAESLPNSVVECLNYGIPVIASDIGEISQMMTIADQKSGYVLPLVDGRVDAFQLSRKMKHYLDNPTLLRQHSELARKCSYKFDMAKCADDYLNLYKETIA